MPRDPRAYLFDIRDAAARIERFVSGRTLEEYRMDDLLRSGVERQFMIAGEAVVQLGHHFPEVAAKLTSRQSIIAFRNILVHAYTHVDDAIVWSLISTGLAVLRSEAEALERSLV